MKTFAVLLSVIIFLAMPCISQADNSKVFDTEKDAYLIIMPTFLAPFTVKTTSPGLSPGETEAEWGIGISGGIGYRYADFRFEGEILYGRSNADSVTFTGGGGDLSGYYEMWEATINIFYDFPLDTPLRPYLGAGLGGIRFSANDITLGGFPPTIGNSNLFTYRLMAGFTFVLNDSWRFVMGYGFKGMGKQDYETGGVPLYGDSIEIHSIRAGLHFYF